ncbi:hypothetical protein Ae201684_013556 [Aphanomyces euteiches]|uniref:Thioesterase domain-containing protein n=1 Tax=Aphanomyces euteiches TaxID=100861 RepID=A0A6G0WMM6_9STRA|nr:hypothetical protein Ae201684_013556 [Aphanomyces euteiches]
MRLSGGCGAPTGIALLLAAPSLCVFGVSLTVFDQPIGTSLALAVAASFVWSDAWYFINQFVHNVLSKLPVPQNDVRSVLETHESYAYVLLNDIDRNGHYNNARYLRACGDGRRNFWKANGVWPLVCRAGGNLIVGAQSVRYRRELTLGERYKLQTCIRTWDKQAFYVEHRFVTGRTPETEFVHAIVLVKNNVIGPKRPQDLINEREPGLVAPPMPRDVECWIESNHQRSTNGGTSRPRIAGHNYWGVGTHTRWFAPTGDRTMKLVRMGGRQVTLVLDLLFFFADRAKVLFIASSENSHGGFDRKRLLHEHQFIHDVKGVLIRAQIDKRAKCARGFVECRRWFQERDVERVHDGAERDVAGTVEEKK